MKKSIFVLLILVLSVFMVCACRETPSTSTDGVIDDTQNSENTNTESGSNGEKDDNTNKENDSEIGGGTGNDENDNVNDGENDNVGADGANDNLDGGENNDANDNKNNDDNVNDGANGDLGNDEPPKEEKPQLNIATQINQPYYKRIYGKYIGADFPEEYGCYYKVIKSYEEFKESVRDAVNIEPWLFSDNYVVVIYEHYETFSHSTYIGYRDIKFSSGASITSDYYFYSNRDYPQGSYIKNTKSIIAVPKKEIPSGEDGSVKKIEIVRERIDSYIFEKMTVSEEKSSELYSGKAWIIKDSESFDELNNQYGLKAMPYYFGDKEIYLLAFYSQVSVNDYILFRDFYTDGKTVYITCQRIILNNTLPVPEAPSIYFVEIPKSIIEHEMSEKIVVHFLVQKTDITMIK